MLRERPRGRPPYDPAEVVAWLTAAPDMTLDDLARAKKITPRALRKRLRRAEAAGLVRRTDGGWVLA